MSRRTPAVTTAAEVQESTTTAAVTIVSVVGIDRRPITEVAAAATAAAGCSITITSGAPISAAAARFPGSSAFSARTSESAAAAGAWVILMPTIAVGAA